MEFDHAHPWNSLTQILLSIFKVYLSLNQDYSLFLQMAHWLFLITSLKNNCLLSKQKVKFPPVLDFSKTTLHIFSTKSFWLLRKKYRKLTNMELK